MGRRRGTFGRLAKAMVARRARAASPVPGPHDDLTVPDVRPWHVRTIILPIPGPHEISLVFANLVTGLTRIRGFDDRPARPGARTGGQLSVVIAGREYSRAGTFTFDSRPAPRADGPPVECGTDLVDYRLAGTWPDYSIGLHVPGWEASIELRAECSEPIVWWSCVPPLYSHYSAFGRTRGTVAVAGRTIEVDAWISLEHGHGSNFGRFPGRPEVPAALFHYQLGALESGEVFAFGCFSSLGLEFFRRGMLFTADAEQREIHDWHVSGVELTTIPDRWGGMMEFPSAFRAQVMGPQRTLHYSAEALGEPHAGHGRLASCGALLDGELSIPGDRTRPITGSLYVEHLYAPGVDPRP